MNLCDAIHKLAMAQGGGTTVITCPETGAKINGFIGPGGTFSPISIEYGPGGRIPTLVPAVAIAPFASAREHSR